MIRVTGPDGAIHKFPDGTDPGVIKGVMGKNYGAPKSQAPSPETMEGGFKQGPITPLQTPEQQDLDRTRNKEDMRRTLTSLPLKIGAGIAGTPGFVEEMAGKGVDLAAQAAGSQYRYPRMLPNPEEIQAGMKSVMPKSVADWTLHEPQTPDAKVVDTTLQLLAPGLKRPGMASLTYPGKIRRLDPGEANLSEGVDRAYDTLKQAGVGYDPRNFTAMTNRVQKEHSAYNLSEGPRGLLDKLSNQSMMARMGNPVHADEIDRTYQEAGEMLAKGGATNTDRKALGAVRKELDDFRRNSPVLTGNMTGPEAMDLLEGARYGASREIKARKLGDIAKTAAELPEGQSEHVRQKIVAILKNKNLRSSYSPEERDLLRKAAKPGVVQSFLTRGGVLGTVGRQALASMFPGAGNIIMGLAEYGAKSASGRKQEQAVKLAQALMRVGPRRAPRRSTIGSPIVRALVAGSTLSDK